MSFLSARDRDRALQDSLIQFWAATKPMVLGALFIHVALLFVFSLLGETVLAVANVCSVLAYVYCLRAIRRGHHRAASLSMGMEIVAHAWLATWQLGWESNFHYYALCILPIIVYNHRTAPKRHVLLTFGIFLTLTSGFVMRGGGHLSTPLLAVFGTANILVALILLLYGTFTSFHNTMKMQLELEHSASHDSLTNLYNRRRILASTVQDEGLGGALILLDIDHFKRVNDRYGHECGDLILQRIADAIRHEVRGSDLAARWGGEEFLVLLPGADFQAAWHVAERIHQRIATVPASLQQGPAEVTATLAVCEIRRHEAFDRALERADQALYDGKREGRDRVMLAA